MADELFFSVFQTAAGWLGIAASKDGLTRVILPRDSKADVYQLLGKSPLIKQPPDQLSEISKLFQNYFSGARVEFKEKLDFSRATPFQRQVWEAALSIPCGETRSYQWVAEKIGKPGAARAVGQALGKNPLPVIVPCHRVLASGGGLGGYSGGIEMKKRLLALESRRGENPGLPLR